MTGEMGGAAFLGELRAIYRDGFAERLADLERRVADLAAALADRGALERICQAVHKIHGSAGSYGFPVTSSIAAEWEAWVSEMLEQAQAPVTAGEVSRMQGYLLALRDSVREE